MRQAGRLKATPFRTVLVALNWDMACASMMGMMGMMDIGLQDVEVKSLVLDAY